VPDARRVYTTFEQPDLKSVFTFHVTAPRLGRRLQRPDARARAARRRQGRLALPDDQADVDVHHRVIAGEYHGVHDTYEGKNGTIPLGHYCRQSLVEHLDRDEVVKITKEGFEFFEEAFDFPYPFEKYDQLYVPEYNMGAMENAGAVTLRDEYLPRSRQDGSFYEFRASVILHEMAHMWFGDLVTMKWWDDLWLNESFAEWACYHAAVENTEFTESWTGFTNARKNWALRQDQLPSTHPIAADNHDLQAVEVNFDGITYAKGASVLKQLVAWVGPRRLHRRPAPVLQGPRLRELRVHRPADRAREVLGPRARLVGQGEAADVGREHAQPGVRARRRRARTPRSGCCRRPRPTTRLLRRHRIGCRPLRLADGHLVRRSHVEVDIEGERTSLDELVGQRQPDLLLLNDGDLTYAKIRLDERSLATVVAGLSRLDDSLARALCWGARGT
jgi:aminopeptidase N